MGLRQSTMNLIPYVWFTFAAIITYNSIMQVLLELAAWDSFELLIFGIYGLLTFSFVFYLLIAGVQELKKKELFAAKFFSVFGLVFELISFFGLLYVLTALIGKNFRLWATTYVFFMLVGILTLVVVDFRKMRAQ